jgi:Protein of unknown function (DUF1553)/Protein of unknown function (DUF1549)/Planctomycete cytochrome C
MSKHFTDRPERACAASVGSFLSGCRIAAAVLVALATFVNLFSSFASEPIDYLKDIKPILKERCYACHAVLKQESELRLDTASSMLKGGSSGPAVVSGKPEVSEILSRIKSAEADSRMPPEGAPLSNAEIERIRTWIQQGAEAPADELPESDPRAHWSFTKPIRPPLPAALGSSQNPIDAWIQGQQDALGIVAMPQTDKATLLRRVYLDLIGLPPSADEILAFLNDDSPTAYEDRVDRLLASPQHGERWGRHWMDVWRYSDWYGRRSVPDVMNSYPMIWRWRDWIVRSINENKAYDQMIVEMLAADEMLPVDDQNIVATGYLVRSWFKWNYETWKKDLVEHTGKAFLGVTLNCCQCHDHKYDPFTQEEYFRFRAFFEPLELRHDRVAGEKDPGRFVKYHYADSYGPITSGMVRVFDEYLDAETFMFSKGDARLKIEGKPPVSAAAPSVVGGDLLQPSPITLPIEAAYPGMKPFIRDEERSRLRGELTAAKVQLDESQHNLASEPVELRSELQAAEIALRVAREGAMRLLTDSAPHSDATVLEGSQSLLLDATVGRRALSHPLLGLDSLADDSTVSYLVKVVQDGHTNLQLGLDIAAGATGGYIAFENGSIKTYTPGGFNECVVGTYDLSKGQNRFRVRLHLKLCQDHFLLTVTSLSDNATIVNETPAALNGWKPQANGKRGLFLDCRPGTKAIYDELAFNQPDGSSLLRCDFEAPGYLEGKDVVDSPLDANPTNHWMVTGFCQSPASSNIVSQTYLNPSVQAAAARYAAAQQALRLPTLKLTAATERIHAVERELAALEQRIAADDARYATGLIAEDRHADPFIKAMIHQACKSEREAAVAKAKANLTSADAAVAAAEVKAAATSANQDQSAIDTAKKELQAAQQNRTNATALLNSANANLVGELGEYTPLSPKYPQVTSGRRTTLARWIANKDNPLTARVAVNHIWLRHFGKAIVETSDNLGRNGSQPTHPELLDWLACELMDSGWSMKHIHRLLVTSRTYQRASQLPVSSGKRSSAIAIADQIDPDNKAYWRFPAARMQAEVLRDSLLAVACELDESRGGHEIDHKQGMTSYRRSLYFAHHGEEKMEFLELFDAPNPCDCYKRSSSVQPQQALALTNSELTKTLSRSLAQRLWESVQTEAEANSRFVRMAFLQVLNREPLTSEMLASQSFLREQSSRLAPSDSNASTFDPTTRARENLVHALMNHNDFVTVR